MKRMFLPVALAMSCSAVAWAQQAARQQPSQQQQPAQSAQQQGNNDRFDRGAARTSTTGEGRSAQDGEQQLKQMLALANQNEIKMAEFAQQRAVSPEVKQFAQLMIKDHQQYLQKLGVQEQARSGSAAGQQTDRSSRDQAANERADGARQSNATAQNSANRQAGQASATNQQAGNQSTSAQSGQQGGQIDFVQLKRDAGERCLQLTQQMLSQKSGQEFDKCYIGSQVGAHIEMLAMLQAAENQVSGELAQTIQQGIQTTQHHLQEAQQIAQQFEQSGGQRSQQGNRANQGQAEPTRQQNSSNNP